MVFDQERTLINTFIPAMHACSVAVGREIALAELGPQAARCARPVVRIVAYVTASTGEVLVPARLVGSVSNTSPGLRSIGARFSGVHIGLIVGIGPAATDYYYRSIITRMHTAGVDLRTHDGPRRHPDAACQPGRPATGTRRSPSMTGSPDGSRLPVRTLWR